MKPYIFLTLLFYNFFYTNAQNIVKKLNWVPHEIYYRHDSITGVKDLDIMQNGNICVLAQIDQNEYTGLYILDPVNYSITWKHMFGSWGGLSSQFTTALTATSDTGIVVCHNFYSQSSDTHVYGMIFKFSPTGTILWSDTFVPVPGQMRTAIDIAEDSTGNYLALVQDTVYKLDNLTGAINQAIPVVQNSNKILLVPGSSDFIVNGFLSSSRYSLSGNLIWTFNHPSFISNYSLSEITSSGFYILENDSLFVVDLSTGNLTNTTSLPANLYSSINHSANGDLFISAGNPVTHFNYITQLQTGSIIKVNSAGNILSVKAIPFPKFGLSWVSELPGGNLFCSGTYLLNTCDPLLSQNYMPFYFTVDQNGNGLIDSTTYLWPGDANNNYVLQFSDDALYILQSFGQTGLARDTLNYTTYYNGLDHSDFLSDWNTINTAGVNDKFCDVSGDGIVDQTDLNAFTPYFSFPVAVSYRSATLPDVTFIPESPTVATGDSARFYIVAGSSMAIDSVSGIAFSNYPTQQAPYGTVQFRTNTLGVPGNTLRTFCSISSVSGNANIAFTKTDLSNVHLNTDTIGIISFYIPVTFTDTSFSTSISEIKAIKGDGSDVPVQAVNGTVMVTTPTSIQENSSDKINLFPNPANGKITVDKIYAGNKAEIIDNSGKIISGSIIPENGTINVSALSKGNYFLKIDYKGNVMRSRFIIVQ